jgi:hypothetical protein
MNFFMLLSPEEDVKILVSTVTYPTLAVGIVVFSPDRAACRGGGGQGEEHA